MIKPEDKNIYAPYLALVNQAIDEFIAETGRKPVLLDVGCGHSSVLEEEYKKCEKVIGVDLDKEGLELNEWVDEKIYGDATEVPLKDNSVDILVSAWVLEHIEFPDRLIKEADRLLGVSGRFVFIAPNKWSIYSMVTRAVPNVLHGPIVKFFYKRPEEDTFPTVFGMNTEKDLDRLMGDGGFEKERFIYNDDELYMSFWRITKPIAKLWQIIVKPNFMRKVRAHVIGLYKKK